MGIITGAASLLGVAGKVSGTVLSLGAGALSGAGKFIKSPIGKLALGAGVMSFIVSKFSDNKEDTLFGKISSGFKGLWDTVKSTVGKFIGTTAAKAQVAAASVAESTATRESLQEMIADDTAAFESGSMPLAASAVPVADEYEATPEEAAMQAYGASYPC